MKGTPVPVLAANGLTRKILDIFRARQGDVVSGEELSSSLDVSRTAVWKHIKSLKDLGYGIEAVPSQGYRLISVPDIPIPAEIETGLATQRIGRGHIICFRETGSTNEVAFRLAEEGAAEGTVVIADCQNHGKGRLGRRWESPPGVNLYCSVILRPDIMPLQASQLTFLSAVAVAEAIEETSPIRPSIKWPNDLLVRGKKVAGLLNEMSAETEKVNFIILGIGININMKESQFPPDLRHPATSLEIEAGHPTNRLALTRNLLRSLDRLYDAYLRDGYEPIRAAWLRHADMIGRAIRVSYLDKEATGEAAGIDDDGALLLRHGDGRLERVLAGDVTIL